MNIDIPPNTVARSRPSEGSSGSELRIALKNLQTFGGLETGALAGLDGEKSPAKKETQRVARKSKRLAVGKQKGARSHSRRGAKLKEAAARLIPFPVRLHDMLQNIEDQGLTSIVSWQPHGRAIRVHKPKEFVQQILPLYFRQTKLTSFQRQLNVYGFERIVYGVDSGAYYHRMFLRGMRFLSFMISRISVKGTGIRRSTCLLPEQEPNFYDMPPPQDPPIEQVLSNDSPIWADDLIFKLDDEEGTDIDGDSMTTKASCESNAPGCMKSHDEGDRIHFEGRSFHYMPSHSLHDDASSEKMVGLVAV